MLYPVHTDYSQRNTATQSAGVDLFANQPATQSIDVNELAMQLDYPTEEILLLAEKGQLCGRKLLSNGKWRFVSNAATMFTRSLVQEYTHRDCSHNALESSKHAANERSYKSSTSRADEVGVINQDSAVTKLGTGNSKSHDVRSQVDFDKGFIYIEASEHKSKTRVSTPISDTAMNLLSKMNRNRSSSYIFLNHDGVPMNELRNSMWKKITEKAKLSGLLFHDLRHNWATNHIESGTDLLALKELGGWRTLDMVQRYAHPSSEYLTTQAKKIDNRIENNLKEPHQERTHVLECDSKGEKSSQVLKCGTENAILEVIGPQKNPKTYLQSTG